MAQNNIFERFGIKEVANVYFQALSDEGNIKAGDIVLYLDTLKVCTVETTAQNVSAQGGKQPQPPKKFPNCWDIFYKDNQQLKLKFNDYPLWSKSKQI